MHRALSFVKVISFADDLKTLLTMKNNTDVSQVVTEKMNLISNVLSAYKLFLNANRIKYLIINNQDRPPPLNIEIILSRRRMFVNSKIFILMNNSILLLIRIIFKQKLPEAICLFKLPEF